MGKNRINIYNNYSKKNNLNNEVTNENLYKTQAGEIVLTGGHTKEWMKDFEWRISDWIKGYTNNPDDELNDEQIEYIKSSKRTYGK